MRNVERDQKLSKKVPKLSPMRIACGLLTLGLLVIVVILISLGSTLSVLNSFARFDASGGMPELYDFAAKIGFVGGIFEAGYVALGVVISVCILYVFHKVGDYYTLRSFQLAGLLHLLQIATLVPIFLLASQLSSCLQQTIMTGPIPPDYHLRVVTLGSHFTDGVIVVAASYCIMALMFSILFISGLLRLNKKTGHKGFAVTSGLTSASVLICILVAAAAIGSTGAWSNAQLIQGALLTAFAMSIGIGNSIGLVALGFMGLTRLESM